MDGIVSLSHYRAQNSGVKPWGHRHPGSVLTPIRQYKISKYYTIAASISRGLNAFTDEKTAAFELSKRATAWWLMRLTHPATLGDCWKPFMDYIQENKTGDWPEFGLLKRDNDEDSEDEEENICVCKEPAVSCSSIQYLNNGEFLLKFNINKQNINQLRITMLDAETEMTTFDPAFVYLDGQVWSNVTSNLNIPGFTLSSLTNRRDVVWNCNTSAGINMNNSQVEVIAKFRQPVNINENLSFCLGFEFLSGNKLCTQTVSISINNYSIGLSGMVTSDIEVY